MRPTTPTLDTVYQLLHGRTSGGYDGTIPSARHPEILVTNCNALPIVRNYLALSEALPLLRSGKLNNALSGFSRNDVLDQDRTIKSYVSLFSEADRRNSVAVMLAVQGHENTVFRTIIQNGLGWPVRPDFGVPTLVYLKRLQLGLTSVCRIDRLAVELAIRLFSDEMVHVTANALMTIAGRPVELPANCTNLWKRTRQPLKVTEDANRNNLDFDFALSGRLAVALRDYYAMGVRWCEEIARPDD